MNSSPQPLDRPGIADLIFLFVALAVLRGASHGLLDDPGLGWHVRNIDAMRQEGGWLTVDPFTDHAGKEAPAWYTNQWLGELPLYLGWKLAGLEGIAVVTALVFALLARLMYRAMVEDGAAWPIALLWTAIGTVGASCSWVSRPNVFTILFVFIAARVCLLFHEGRLSRSRTWWLLPLFAIWANTHGGFLAGFIVLGGTLGCEVLLAVGALSEEARREAKGRAAHLLLLCLGAFVATLANPYGVKLYSWTFQLLGETYFMDLHQEWKSPDFHAPGAMRYELVLLLFPLVLAASERRPGLVELGLSIVWLHFALGGFRYVAIWVVIVIPVMARSSLQIAYLREQARRWELNVEPGSLFFTRQGASPWLWTALFCASLVAGAWTLQGQFAGHGPNIIATRALDRFIEIADQWEDQQGREPRVFHSYDWGGYLTWHGWPMVHNWIDDRNEVQGKEKIEVYFQILRAEPGWEKRLTDIDLICVESGAALTRQLASSKHWRERYRDEQAVIYERISRGP